MTAIEFLRSKGMLDADHEEFKIKYPDGKVIELGALLEEYAELVKNPAQEIKDIEELS